LIRRFAEARNAHDGSAVAALYSEDGEFLDAAGEVAIHSRQNLAAIWSNLPGQVARSIESIDFPTASMAIVHVAMHSDQSLDAYHETFVAINESGVWRIRLHQPGK
jgi:hypothetical protein